MPDVQILLLSYWPNEKRATIDSAFFGSCRDAFLGEPQTQTLMSYWKTYFNAYDSKLTLFLFSPNCCLFIIILGHQSTPNGSVEESNKIVEHIHTQEEGAPSDGMSTDLMENANADVVITLSTDYYNFKFKILKALI